MLDLYLKGGFLMHPILIASVIGLGIVLERAWFFWRADSHVGPLFETLAERISKGDPEGALEAAGEHSGPVGLVLREGLKHWKRGPEMAQEVMAIRGEEALRSARRGISLLALVPSVSVMLGLLGTVVGMVEAFQRVAEMEQRVSPALLASGIWTALITTVGGLCVAIPILIAHHYFQEKIAHLAFQIEHYGSELILLLKQERSMK